mgnify:CR=1 FL=1
MKTNKNKLKKLESTVKNIIVFMFFVRLIMDILA